MLAVKIFSTDTEAPQLALLSDLERMAPQNWGLELALYGARDFTEAVCAAVQALPVSRKILHAAHSSVGLRETSMEKPTALAQLTREGRWCQMTGVGASVVHATTNDRLGLAGTLDPRLAARAWARAIDAFNRFGLRPHLENTGEPLTWFEAFFDEWDRMGLAKQAGFCLDIGHARVWNYGTLDAWSAFTRQVAGRGFALHFHVHANHGVTDEHLALHLAHTEGLLEPSSDWAPGGVIAWLAAELQAHPAALFTLENSSAQAAEAFCFTRFALESGDAGNA